MRARVALARGIGARPPSVLAGWESFGAGAVAAHARGGVGSG